VLLKDVNPGSAGSNPGGVFAAGGTLWFSALETSTGREPWKSDGTTAGTVLLGDLAPGPDSSSPADFAWFQGRVWFAASDGAAHGSEPWRTDGTGPGTAMAVDLNPGPTGSAPAGFTEVNNLLLFVANVAGIGRELWRHDGTGAALVADLAPGGGSSSPSSLVRVGARLFFTASEANGQEVWTSDGMTASITRDVAPGPAGSSPRALAAFGGNLLFAANDGTTGSELWRSDGTFAGTFQVRDVAPGSASGMPAAAFIAAPAGAARALFQGSDGLTGTELWRTDGTAPGTVLHQDLNPGAGSSSPSAPALAGSLLFLSANDGVRGNELWALGAMAAAPPWGTGCRGTGGLVPRIEGVGGAPVPGNASFGVEVQNALPLASAWLVLGFSPVELPLGGGCSLYVNLAPIALLFPRVTSGAGVATVALPVPLDPLLIGVQLFAQWAIADPAGGFSGLALTGGLKVVIGAA
jgi:ELWxxDGT repeat protein